MAAAGLDVVDFVDVGIECTLEQLLGSAGYFHADPHPGARGYRVRAPYRARSANTPQAPRSTRAAAAGGRRVNAQSLAGAAPAGRRACPAAPPCLGRAGLTLHATCCRERGLLCAMHGDAMPLRAVPHAGSRRCREGRERRSGSPQAQPAGRRTALRVRQRRARRELARPHAPPRRRAAARARAPHWRRAAPQATCWPRAAGTCATWTLA